MIRSIVVALLIAFLAPAQASAVLLNYTVSGDASLNWFMLSDRVPTAFSPTQVDFRTNYGAFGYDGPVPIGVADVFLFALSEGGGLQIANPGGDAILDATGAQLYGGSSESPNLLTGIFALAAFEGTGRYTLTVSEAFRDPPTTPPAPAVPEPGTWAMMLAGFAGLGLTLRRRRYQAAAL